MNNSYVLDASALLALLNEEPGSEYVSRAIEQGAVIGTVNLSEVVSKLNELGIPAEVIQEILQNLGLNVVDFDQSLAYEAGLLRLKTKKAGLSFGDRACLSLAENLQKPCLTADMAWADLELFIEVKIIR